MRLMTRFGLITVAILVLGGASCEEDQTVSGSGGTSGDGEEEQVDPGSTGSCSRSSSFPRNRRPSVSREPVAPASRNPPR